MKKTVLKDLDSILATNDGSISTSDIKKIKTYYGVLVPALFGECFCLLHQHKMSKKERECLSYISALSGLFDDFFDEKNTSDSHIIDLITMPQTVKAQNTHEQLFIIFWKKALLNSTSPMALAKALTKVYEAQIESRKQKNNSLDREHLLQITKQKGAYSLLFYRSALVASISDLESNVIVQMGFVAQLENDLFDIYKDLQQHIQTIYTSPINMGYEKLFYSKLLDDFDELVLKMNVSRKNKLEFLHSLNLIFCRTFVCFDNLEKSMLSGEELLNPILYERKHLICDMEKLSNVFRLFNHFAKRAVLIDERYRANY